MSRIGRALPLPLYLLLTFASFYPQSVRPWDTVAYVGDSLESVYIVAWNVHQLFSSPAHLFDANVLYPHRRSLALTDHRLVPSLLVAPVLWGTGNAVLAYNVSLALASLLAAFAGRHLAGVLGADPIGAWCAGALYAFHTYQINEAPRLNIVFHGFIPLALGQLILFLRTGEARRAWATAGFMFLQGLSSLYHLAYGSFLLGLVTVGALLARPKSFAKLLPSLLLAASTAACAFLPVATPYLAAARTHGYVRELPVGVDLQHYLSTSPTNILYGPLGTHVRRQQQGPHFVGFASLALAGLALAAWALRRGPEPQSAVPAAVWVPAAAALALLFTALSLGRDMAAFGHSLGPGPYRLLHGFVPGFQLMRIPERLGLLAMLFVALLVARGLSLLAGKLRTLALVLAALVPIEHLSPLSMPERVPVGSSVPQVYRWLRENPVRAMAELPIRGEGLVREETLEMYFSTVHFRPLIQGYTAFPPLMTRLLRRLAAQFPSEVSLQALQRIGVDTVVVHHGRPVAVDLFNQIRAVSAEEAEERFARTLRLAGLDLYARLPEAVASGRIRLEARFAGEGARLFESTADEVYRLQPQAPTPAAPLPRGRRLSKPGWRYRTKIGDPSPAADSDLATAWEVRRPLLGDEFFEVTFDRPLPVAGVVLPLRRDSCFPTRFRVAGKDVQGRWVEVARFDDAHALQLLDSLKEDPRHAALGFDLGGRELTGVSLLVEEGGTSFEGWSLPEVEVWVP